MKHVHVHEMLTIPVDANYKLASLRFIIEADRRICAQQAAVSCKHRCSSTSHRQGTSAVAVDVRYAGWKLLSRGD